MFIYPVRCDFPLFIRGCEDISANFGLRFIPSCSQSIINRVFTHEFFRIVIVNEDKLFHPDHTFDLFQTAKA